jgi:hypothetical protein
MNTRLGLAVLALGLTALWQGTALGGPALSDEVTVPQLSIDVTIPEGTEAAVEIGRPGLLLTQPGIGVVLTEPSSSVSSSVISDIFYTDANHQAWFVSDNETSQPVVPPGIQIFAALPETGSPQGIGTLLGSPYQVFVTSDVETQQTPEPTSLAIWSLLGAIGVGVSWWRLKK